MWQVLTAPESLPFAVALAVVLGIAVLEGAALALGIGGSGIAELLPDDAGAGADGAGADGAGAVSRFTAWLHVGRLPLPMLLVVALTGFGVGGLAVQAAASGLLGRPLPAMLAVLPALALAVPATRFAGGFLARIMPREETDALPAASLVGRIGIITIGTARPGHPAEARVRDGRGTTHYQMVEPLEAGDAFPAGSAVLLVSHEGAVFKAVPNPSPALIDRP
jgi:hypothetical protein